MMRFIPVLLFSTLIAFVFAAAAAEQASYASPAVPISPPNEAVSISKGQLGGSHKAIAISRNEIPIGLDESVSCSISPNPASIPANGLLEFRARCFDANGAAEDCPEGVWDSDAGMILMQINVTDRAILIANSQPMDGYISFAAGSSSLDEARRGRNGFSCSAQVAVMGDAHRVEITPSNASVQQGGSQRFFARLVDSANHALYPASWVWSLNGSIGSLENSTSSDALFTAQEVGSGYVVAQAIPATRRIRNPLDSRDDPDPIRRDPYVGMVQVTVTSAPQPLGGGAGGAGGNSGAGGNIYFGIGASGRCAGQPLEISVSSGGRPVPGAEVKLFLDTGPLKLIGTELSSDSGKASFTPKQAGKYLVRAVQGSYQQSAMVQVADCQGGELAPVPAPSGTIGLKGNEETLLSKELSWNSGFTKKVTVTKDGDSASTRVTVTYVPPEGYVAGGYEIIDYIPASIASRAAIVRLDSAADVRSEQPLTFAFKPSQEGRTVVSYVIERQLTSEMVALLPEPKLQKSVSAEAEAGSGPGIGDSLLAAMRGTRDFFTKSDFGMLIGVLLGGIILVVAIYFVAFRKEGENE